MRLGVSSLRVGGIVVHPGRAGTRRGLGFPQAPRVGVAMLERQALRLLLQGQRASFALAGTLLPLARAVMPLRVAHSTIISRTLVAHRPQPYPAASAGRIHLFDVEPDLARFVTDDERPEVRMVTVPVAHLGKAEAELSDVLAESRAFGAVVLDGMLLQRMRLGEHEAMRLIGPGDVLALDPPPSSSVLQQLGRRAIADTRLALLGNDFLAAARRWPGLFAGLHVRAAEQAERVAAQVAVCQLPRVADRLLAMMWLLAESWGRVTPSGVVLPVMLTHEALGELIGARRPTVSLALGELIDRGATVRQDAGWLLLEGLPEAARAGPSPEPPALLDDADSRWAPPPPPLPPPRHELVGAELMETVRRLRAEVGQSRVELDSTLAEVRRNRARIRRGRAERAKPGLS